MHMAQLGRVEGVHVRGAAFDLGFGSVHRADRSRAHVSRKRNYERRLIRSIFMKSQWFVIHTLSGQEQKVKESIEKRMKAEEMGEFIKEVLVPIEKVVDVRGGKKTVTSRKLHPGYVYID